MHVSSSIADYALGVCPFAPLLCFSFGKTLLQHAPADCFEGSRPHCGGVPARALRSCGCLTLLQSLVQILESVLGHRRDPGDTAGPGMNPMPRATAAIVFMHAARATAAVVRAFTRALTTVVVVMVCAMFVAAHLHFTATRCVQE